jgi:hypothetical protein
MCTGGDTAGRLWDPSALQIVAISTTNKIAKKKREVETVKKKGLSERNEPLCPGGNTKCDYWV